jgi:transcriptional regulator with XRE-family HTH domain
MEDTGLSVRRIADDSGIGYDALASYRLGRREPSPETVLQIADALEKRAEKIRKVATRLYGLRG